MEVYSREHHLWQRRIFQQAMVWWPATIFECCDSIFYDDVWFEHIWTNIVILPASSGNDGWVTRTLAASCQLRNSKCGIREAKMTSVGKMLRFNSWSESCCWAISHPLWLSWALAVLKGVKHVKPSIFIYIHLYSSIFIYIHLYTSIFIYIHLYSSIFIYIHLYSSIFIDIHLYSSLQPFKWRVVFSQKLSQIRCL